MPAAKKIIIKQNNRGGESGMFKGTELRFRVLVNLQVGSSAVFCSIQSPYSLQFRTPFSIKSSNSLA